MMFTWRNPNIYDNYSAHWVMLLPFFIYIKKFIYFGAFRFQAILYGNFFRPLFNSLYFHCLFFHCLFTVMTILHFILCLVYIQNVPLKKVTCSYGKLFVLLKFLQRFVMVEEYYKTFVCDVGKANLMVRSGK